jgi:hypothetical protein
LFQGFFTCLCTRQLTLPDKLSTLLVSRCSRVVQDLDKQVSPKRPKLGPRPDFPSNFCRVAQHNATWFSSFLQRGTEIPLRCPDDSSPLCAQGVSNTLWSFGKLNIVLDRRVIDGLVQQVHPATTRPFTQSLNMTHPLSSNPL